MADNYRVHFRETFTYIRDGEEEARPPTFVARNFHNVDEVDDRPDSLTFVWYDQTEEESRKEVEVMKAAVAYVECWPSSPPEVTS